VKTIPVEFQRDHLEALTRARTPVAAIADPVWNGLDADAEEVRVEFEEAPGAFGQGLALGAGSPAASFKSPTFPGTGLGLRIRRLGVPGGGAWRPEPPGRPRRQLRAALSTKAAVSRAKSRLA
jgi:hypothetical protein